MNAVEFCHSLCIIILVLMSLLDSLKLFESLHISPWGTEHAGDILNVLAANKKSNKQLIDTYEPQISENRILERQPGEKGVF